MKLLFIFLMISFSAISIMSAINWPGADKGKPEQSTPIVVELFTSEGCSSCPPADALLARLIDTQPIKQATVIALSEHVDYWNRLGWQDPYSAVQFSKRQQEYAQVFGSNRIYTPQMIVDGEVEFVGSDINSAYRAIAQATHAPKASVQLHLVNGGVKDGIAGLQVNISSCPAANSMIDLWLAVTEDNLSSNVLRGENAGRQLKHSSVVRYLENIGTIKPGETNIFNTESKVAWNNLWQQQNCKIAVFLQARANHQILGAAAIKIAQ